MNGVLIQERQGEREQILFEKRHLMNAKHVLAIMSNDYFLTKKINDVIRE